MTTALTWSTTSSNSGNIGVVTSRQKPAKHSRTNRRECS